MPSTGLGDFTEYDDDVAKNVAKVVDPSNPLITKARQDGLDLANSRGLGNSSIAAGASQREVLKVAVPLGTQQSQINAQKNIQSRDITAQSGRLTQQLGSNEAIAERDAANKLALQGMDNDSRELIARMNVTSNQQDKAQSAALTAYNIYTSQINAISNNKDIPADVRSSYLARAKSEWSANVGLIEQLYNIDLNWSGDTASFNEGTSYGGGAGAQSQAAGTNYGGADQGSGGLDPYANVGNANNNTPSGWDDMTVAYTDPGGNQYNAAGRHLGTI